MALYGGCTHHLLRRARASGTRVAWMTIALLASAHGVRARTFPGTNAEGACSSARAPAPATELPALADVGRAPEAVGAGAWMHAPSLGPTSDRSLRLYLDTARSGRGRRFSEVRPAGGGSIAQGMEAGDRSDADGGAPGGVKKTPHDTWNAIEFLSEPLAQATELSGQFSGRLDLVTNKKDFNFSVMLFELTPGGAYIQLSSYWARASALGDAAQEHLLTPGVRQRLAFRSERLMSRRVERGSRLVLVLGIIRDPGRQIDPAPGRPGRGESVTDAGVPLTIRWFDDSYIELPVGAAPPSRGNRPEQAAPALPLPRAPTRTVATEAA